MRTGRCSLTCSLTHLVDRRDELPAAAQQCRWADLLTQSEQVGEPPRPRVEHIADLVHAEGLAASGLQSHRTSRYARSPDCSCDRGLARYAAFMPPDVWSLAGEGVNHQFCWQAGRTSHDRPCPGGLSWFTRIPGQRRAIPRARRRRSRQQPGTGQHDRAVGHRARHRACGGRLRGIAERAVACCGAGLRRERVHTQGQKVQPCADSARQCRRAHCPHRYSSPTRSTRYAAPVAGPHRSHVSFISRHLRSAGPRCPARCTAFICSPPHICCPGSARMTAVGHHRTVRGSIRR